MMQHRRVPTHRRDTLGWGHVIAVIAVVTVAWCGALLLTPPKADAAPVYGGCAEAWPYYVDTPGAQDCRERGWVIRRHLIVSPNGHAQTDLPGCRQEDSARCYWNATTRGNGKGRGFVTAGKFYWMVDTINGDLASTNLLYRYDRYWR